MEWEAAARKIVLGRSIGCTIAGFALAIFLPWEYGAPLAIALLAIPLNAGSCRFWALQTTLETKKTIVASRLSQIVGGATKLALLAFGAPGWLFAIASPVTEWTQTLWLTKGIKYPTPNPEKTKSLRGQAKTLRQSVLLKYMTAVLPNLGLGMVSATAAGIFAGATRLSSTAATGMGLYSQSVNPKVMNTGKWYDEWKMLTLAGAGLGILLWLTTPWLIPLLFGTAFNEAVAVGKILALGLIAEAGNSTLEAALVSKGETKGISRCWFIATGVSSVTSGVAWTCGVPPWEVAAIFAISMSIATGVSMLVLLKQKPQIESTATGQAVEMP